MNTHLIKASTFESNLKRNDLLHEYRIAVQMLLLSWKNKQDETITEQAYLTCTRWIMFHTGNKLCKMFL